MSADNATDPNRISIIGTYGSADIEGERTAEGALITMGMVGEDTELVASLDPQDLLRFAEWALALALAHGAKP